MASSLETDAGLKRGAREQPATRPLRARRSFWYWLSYARSVIFTNNLIFLYTAVLATISLAGSLFDPHGRWQHGCARLWSRLILKTGGVRVRVEGAENLNPHGTVIFCVNHPSAVDIPILLATLPVQFRFLAKRELFQLPFLGWFLRRAGHISVERARPHEARHSFEEAAAKIRQGTPVVLFPEGHRNRLTPEMLPFKSGSFYLAVTAGVPIQPVTLNGTRYVHEPDTLHVRPGKVEMVIHPLIPTAGLKRDDVSSLSGRVREALLSRFKPGVRL